VGESAAPAPRISIVTPNRDHGAYLEAAMASVLDQDYPSTEYVVMDGGSTDASLEIIRRHADRLAYWESQPDHGQAQAINRGFAHTSGEIMAWLNADDLYCPWAFRVVAEIFAALPRVEWLTSTRQIVWGASGIPLTTHAADGYARIPFFYGRNVGGTRASRFWIQQESTFWRRSLWERAGGRVDEGQSLIMDFELWTRFWEHADLVSVDVPLGGFRTHGAQKTGGGGLRRYEAEAGRLLAGRQGQLPPFWQILARRKAIALAGRFASRVGYRAPVAVFDLSRGTWVLESRYIA
jgi:glycosyltransferase involved in cell wall biosynthesis